MRTSRKIRTWTRAAVCVAVLAGLTCGAFAGVGARRDGGGRFVGPSWHVTEVKPLDRIWSDFNDDAAGFSVLNPEGDANGDLWPAVAENPIAPHHPWVVWSRFNGTEYDLAWARWKGARWSTVRRVHKTTTRGDDLDADLAFGAEGRPHLVWWRNEDGVGRVFLSVFLKTRWMGAVQISNDAIDGRHPTIEILPGGTVLVEYETPRGLFTQFVGFHRPATITDDINPFSFVELISHASLLRRR